MAGALQDNCRAALTAPSRSYGKGLIQGAYALSDGSAVILTVAQYVTPLHHEIQVYAAD